MDTNHHLVSEVFYEVHIWTFGWPIHDLEPCLGSSEKSLVARAVWDEALSWTRTNCSGRWLLPRVRGFIAAHVCTLAGSWRPPHSQLTFAAIVKSTPYDDRGTHITICSLHTGINMPLDLPPTHRAPPSAWCNLNLDSSVKIQCRQWRML